VNILIYYSVVDARATHLKEIVGPPPGSDASRFGKDRRWRGDENVALRTDSDYFGDSTQHLA